MPSQPGSPAPALRPSRTQARSLAAVAARLGLPAPPGGGRGTAAEVTGVTLDSRSVRPGDLYAALPGAHAHGADFAAAAVAAGAVAVLTDPVGAPVAGPAGVPVLCVPDPRSVLGRLAAWVYGDPGDALRLVGITGTNGKTTTAYLVDAGLRGAGLVTGLVGTVETRIRDRTHPSARTTPESTDLQALLAVMREDGVQAVAMEVSSHALVLGRVDGLVVDVAVFTNLSRDHLDFHADLEDYFAAKAALFTPGRSRHGVVDVDDAYGARLAVTATVPVTTVSPAGAPGADWRVVGRSPGLDGASTSFRLAGPQGVLVDAVSPLPGEFNLANTALAVVACLHLGTAAAAVVSGLAGLAGVPGRMERVRTAAAGGPAREPLVVVDYAHTPAAIENVLVALRGSTSGRLGIVLGAGGDRDPGKRAAMGAAAARHADVVVVTDDNPRSEDPGAIRAAVLAGARAAGGPAEVREVADRATAIRAAVAGSTAGDVVVVAGKGHEQGQEVAGVLLPFDDRTVARAALLAAGARAQATP